ncbi:MAG: YfhO family protein [Elusimicrobia bacterium]|nr:YfhO family protein [Elusimicrobiota bacterium]
MPELSRFTRKDFIYLEIFMVLILAYFGRLLFTDSTFYARDISQYYRPVKRLAVESVQQGIFPFWNPYISGGMPFFATVQHGLLYPLSVGLFFFPFEWGFKYVLVAQIILTGIGLYFLLSHLGLSRWARCAALPIYVVSGTALSLLNLVTSLQAITWFCFGLLFFQKALSGQRWWQWPILLGLVLACQFYAGQPEIMYFTFLFLFLFGLSTYWSHGLRVGKVLLIAGVLSGLLVGIELLPFKELVQWSSRPANNSIQSLYWALPPKQLGALVWPVTKFSQPPWLKSIYLGIVPLLLCVLAVFKPGKKDDLRRGWITVLLVSAVMALGTNTPIYHFIRFILPGLALIRYPVKFFIFTNLFLVILAAYGWERLEFLCRSRIVKTSVLLIAVISGFYITGRLEQYVPISQAGEQGTLSATLKNLGEYRYGLTPWTYTHVTAVSSDLDSLPDNRRLEDRIRWAMLPNMAMGNHLAILRGYESINLGRFEDFYALLSFQPGPSTSLILDLLGIKYLVSLRTIADPGLTLIEDRGWKIYEKKVTLPRIFLTDEAVNRYNNLSAMMFKLKQSISFTRSAVTQNYTLNSIRIKARAAQAGTLVLGDVYYPGWRAYVDGKETAVFPAYYLFRGIAVPAGEHEVVFTYQPTHFVLGLTVSLVSLLLLSVIFLRSGVKSCV